MDYIQSTGSKLLDLELERMLDRVKALENASAQSGTVAATPPPVPSTLSVAGAVSSLTLTGTAPMAGDLIGTISGSLTATQTAPQAFTLSVPTLLAGSNITLTPGSGTLTITATGGAASGPLVNVLYIPPQSRTVSASLTEYANNKEYRAQHDLTNATEARICFLLPSAALLLSPPTWAAQYSTNGGSTWAYLDGTSGPSVLYASGFTTVISSWVTLASGALADVLLRIVESGGDGTTSIALGSFYLQAK